ncbi:copper-binding protein [Synoicihabitans lomoniglobus]|nr:copper-binding protein [Opitutaceae bacterium LMO-M01]
MYLRRLPHLGLLLALAAAAVPGQTVTFEERNLAAGSGSATPQFASAYDGSLYVSWTESAANHAATLLISRFDRGNDAWLPPVQIATGTNWFVNWADTPTIAAGLRGKVAAVWSVNNPDDDHGYHAVYATSEDHGQTWSAPAPLSTESHATEFVEVAPLINGQWLAIWLDGRDRAGHHGAGNMQLRSRLLGSDEPDTLIDARVCDCCSISALVLPNGAVLAAYRDRSDDEIRDIAYARYSRGEWTTTTAPATDGWHIAGCPVNGPKLSRRGAHVAVSWFTGEGDDPRVMTARSNNIGNSWNFVSRVDDPSASATRGAVSSAVTRDGSQWTTWVETNGSIALRRVNRDNELGPIHHLPNHAAAGGRAGGVPRMTLLDNRSDAPARLIIARTVPGSGDTPGRVTTHIASIAPDTDATLDDCGCGPSEAETRGHALRGRIEGIMADRNALLVAHEEIPGVMRAMTMMFQVDPRVIPLVKAEQNITARMERREDGKWWLFNIRLLNTVK